MPPKKTTKAKRLDRPPKSKRTLIQAACITCRRRKLACDGERPTCNRCARRGDECIYTTHDADETRNEALKREIAQLNASLSEVTSAFKAIHSLPASTVVDLVQRASSTSDPLRAFIDGGQSMASSAVHMSRVPSAPLAHTELMRPGSRLESELLRLHPGAYAAVYNVDEVLRRAPGAMGDELFRLSSPQPASYHHTATQAPLLQVAPSGPLSSLFCVSCYDSRLHYLQIKYWTEVDISNELAANILSFWLSTEHPLVGCFDADLFLQDLVSRRTQFCSRLLVNAVLFAACRGHLAPDLGKPNLCEAFLAEAETTLLHYNADAEPLLTVSALYTLVLGLHADGKPEQALQYMTLACRLGDKLHLYGPSAAIHEGLMNSPQRFRSLVVTAWSTFTASVNWAYFQRDSKPVQPPSLSKPSESLEMWSKSNVYQDSNHPRAAEAQKTMLARIGLAQILYQILAEFQHQKDVAGDGVAMTRAEASFNRLLGWLDELPPSFKQTYGMPDHVAILRIWVHSIILDLFRPLAHIKQPLPSLQTPDNNPEAIMAASSRQIQQLVLTGIMSYPSIRMSQHWVPPLVYACNAAVKLHQGREAAFLLKTYVTALLGLCSCFAVAASTVRGIMEMALRAGKISIREARQINEQVQEREKNIQWCEEARSTFVLDLDLGHLGASVTGVQVDRLAEEFEGRLAFEEFVGDDDADGERQDSATFFE